MSFSKTFIYFGQMVFNYFLIVAACFIIINIAALLNSLFKKTKFTPVLFDINALLMVLAFSFLGFAIGVLIGLSQSPVVGATIPALLTFYGGFLTYLFAKDLFKNEAARNAVVVSVIAVSIFVIYGVEIGVERRKLTDKDQKFNELYFLDRQEEIKKKYR
jgi:hypothetical protein